MFHATDLFENTVDGIRINAKKTADGRRWQACAYIDKAASGWGAPFLTRTRAAYDAMARIKANCGQHARINP